MDKLLIEKIKSDFYIMCALESNCTKCKYGKCGSMTDCKIAFTIEYIKSKEVFTKNGFNKLNK